MTARVWRAAPGGLELVGPLSPDNCSETGDKTMTVVLPIQDPISKALFGTTNNSGVGYRLTVDKDSGRAIYCLKNWQLRSRDGIKTVKAEFFVPQLPPAA